MSLSVTAYPFPWGRRELVLERGQGTPWTSRQLIAGPSLMSNWGVSISVKDSLALPGAGI